MPIRPRVLGVGRHQSLLDSEDEVVCGVECRRGERRIGTAEADLQRADRFAQLLWYLDVVVEAEPLDVIEQAIGLRHQGPASLLDLIAVHPRDGCGGHREHHKRLTRLVKYRFTSRQLVQGAWAP
jgi:hypothetical protein